MRHPFAILLACTTLVACSEDFESRYATTADVRQAGAGTRSWLPTWLPESATDIRERHNIDSNATLVAFTVPSATPSLLVGCRPGRVAPPRGGASWWPSNEEFDQLDHFTCEERMVFGDGHVETWRTGAALDRKANRVYFWRGGR